MDEQKIKYVSLTDLEQDQDELVGFRPNVDANAFLPPLPHAEYNVLVNFAAEDPDKRWVEDITKKGDTKKFYKTVLKVDTAGNENDEYNGRTYDHYTSTLVRKNGTTGVQAVLQGLGVPQDEINVNKTHRGQTGLLMANIDNGANEATVEIDWEASHYDADFTDAETGEKIGKEWYRLRGQERFPAAVETEGEYDKAIPDAKGVRRYPWIDLDITDINDPEKPSVTVVFPDQTPEPGRNIQRCFVRNVLRRFVTRTDVKAGLAGGASTAKGGVSARPVTTTAAAGAGTSQAPSAVTPTAVAGGPPRPTRPAPTRGR